MKDELTSTVVQNYRTILIVVLLILLVSIGAVGEVAAQPFTAPPSCGDVVGSVPADLPVNCNY